MTFRIHRLIGVLLLALSALPAAAQSDKTIRIIVPIAPGSLTDIAARLTAQELAIRTGQTVVVINRPGGNMAIAGAECAKSPPDGTTLCIVSSDTMSYNPFIIPNLAYDPEKDFRPVTNMYYVIDAIQARATLPASSVAELQKLAAAKPKELNFGTLGPRTTTDTFRLWLGEFWQTEFVAVPYRGGNELVAALLAGTIDITRSGVGNLVGQLNEGRVKVLAIRSSRRSPLLPNIQTMDEAGLGSFPGGRVWWGMVVPAGTPDAVVQKLNADLVDIFRAPKFAEFAEKQFMETAAGSIDEFAAFLKDDRERAGVLVKRYMSQ